MYRSDIHYISSGRFECDGMWIHPERTIDSAELICVTQGEFLLEAGDEQLILKRGGLLNISPFVPHRGLMYSSGVTFYWMHYQGSFPISTWYAGNTAHISAQDLDRIKCDKAGSGQSDESQRENIRRGHRQNLSERADTDSFFRTEHLFRQLLHIANSSGYPPEAGELAARLLLIEALRSHEENQKNEPELIFRISEWIRNNSVRQLKVSDIADKFGYNADYLTKAFYKSRGITLKAAIDSSRMNKIKSMLISHDIPLKELASTFGFQDYKLFLKYFTYHEKMSPTEYRNMYSGIHINNS